MGIDSMTSALQSLQSYDYATATSESTAYAASVKMLDNAMDISETLNTKLIQSMEQSVNPNLGQSIDIRI